MARPPGPCPFLPSRLLTLALSWILKIRRARVMALLFLKVVMPYLGAVGRSLSRTIRVPAMVSLWLMAGRPLVGVGAILVSLGAALAMVYLLSKGAPWMTRSPEALRLTAAPPAMLP